MHCAEETYLREGPPEDERKREGSAKDSSKCRCTQEQGPCDHHRHEPWREGWVVDEEPGWMTERPFRVPTPRDNPATSQQSHMHRLAHSAWHTHTLEDTTVIHHRHDHTHEYAHTGQDITEAQQETRVREEPGKGDWSIPPNPRLLECFRGRHPLIDLRDREPFD